VTWDGRDTAGRALPSGAYVARFEAGDVRQSHKLMLVR
jgi:flagellar hook assembly protein FlgD